MDGRVRPPARRRGGKTRDSDFIVVGPNSVTVIGEKSWHGELLGTEERWYDRHTHQELGSPINQANGVARVLAGNIDRLLRHHRGEVGDLVRGAAPGRPAERPPIVEYLVVLSSPDVRFDVADPRAADRAVRLVGCERRLLEFDRSTAARIDLGPVRDRILTMVEGLPERELKPAQLGSYRIVGDIESTPRGPRYVGEHRDGAVRILMTYRRQGLSAAELVESGQLPAVAQGRRLRPHQDGPRPGGGHRAASGRRGLRPDARHGVRPPDPHAPSDPGRRRDRPVLTSSSVQGTPARKQRPGDSDHTRKPRGTRPGARTFGHEI